VNPQQQMELEKIRMIWRDGKEGKAAVVSAVVYIIGVIVGLALIWVFL